MGWRSLLNTVIRAVGLDRFWVQIALFAVGGVVFVIWFVAKLRKYQVPVAVIPAEQPIVGQPTMTQFVPDVQHPSVAPVETLQPQPVVQPQPIVQPQPVIQPKPVVRKGRKARIEMNMDSKLAELTSTRDNLLQEFIANPKGVWASEEAKMKYIQATHGIEMIEELRGDKNKANKAKTEAAEPR